jgi:hypothetical protein
MAAIDRNAFASECLTQANEFGAWAHYLLAVAQLRSKIDDGVKDGKFGPFMLTQDQWNAHRDDPDVGLEKNDIQQWDMQCLLFASWTHDVHQGLVTANGQNPTSEDIYHKQFPGDPVDGFDQALDDTKGLLPAAQAIANDSTTLPVKTPT